MLATFFIVSCCKIYEMQCDKFNAPRAIGAENVYFESVRVEDRSLRFIASFFFFFLFFSRSKDSRLRASTWPHLGIYFASTSPGNEKPSSASSDDLVKLVRIGVVRKGVYDYNCNNRCP